MTLRIAVLGYGFVADLHTRAARRVGLEVVGVAGHRADRAADFAARHGIAWSGDDWEGLIARSDVDAVVIGTPNALHHPQALRALELGRHVLVDKPMALTVAEGREMIAAARDAGRVLAVGHMWRHRAEVVALRDRVAAGELGRVVRTHGWGVHAGWGPSGWFTEPALSGGGALIDMGIHALDTARFLLGDPEPVRVQASIGLGEFADHGLDDDGLVVVDWEGGARSLVEFGWWQPRLGGLEADTEVLGTAGHARIWDPAPPTPDYVHCDVPMYAAQLGDFADACASGRTPVSSAEVGLTALWLVERAYEAAEPGPA